MGVSKTQRISSGSMIRTTMRPFHPLLLIPNLSVEVFTRKLQTDSLTPLLVNDLALMRRT
jgi:hypothetical protein